MDEYDKLTDESKNQVIEFFKNKDVEEGLLYGIQNNKEFMRHGLCNILRKIKLLTRHDPIC
jgi:hypothetical protein